MTDHTGPSGVDDFQPPLTRRGHAWRLVLMVIISGLVLAEAARVRTELWWVPIDLALGVLALGLVHLRRRHPLSVTVAVLTVATFAASGAGPAVLATVSVATRRIYWQLAVVGLLNLVSIGVYSVVHPTDTNDPWWLSFALSVVLTLALLGWGMYIGSRRELLWTLRQRAERAEAERDLRTAKAQSDERARIAREMHDVLAHRISQISMHAGALAFRDDLDAPALRSGIGEVQHTANEALNDLRNVLGVLRDPGTGTVTHRPQPTYEDLGELVDSARAAGARIELHDRLDDHLGRQPVPSLLGRTLYRVVQEGITNAQKHAPGALLRVELTGDPDRGVELLLSNPLRFGPPAAPGSGLGLAGLAERVELAGGQLDHGSDGTTFTLRAWLPWAT